VYARQVEFPRYEVAFITDAGIGAGGRSNPAQRLWGASGAAVSGMAAALFSARCQCTTEVQPVSARVR
jgi:hypothetical protein